MTLLSPDLLWPRRSSCTWLRLIAVAFGSVVCTAALTASCSALHVFEAEMERVVARAPTPVQDGDAIHLFRFDRWRDEQYLIEMVADSDGDFPITPGLPPDPQVDVSYLSPGLADLVAANPTLAKRFPHASSELIGPAGLLSPDELRVVTFSRAEELVENEASSQRFDEYGAPSVAPHDLTLRDEPRLTMVIPFVSAFIVVPAAVLLAFCVRVGSDRRDWHVEMLRRLGVREHRLRVHGAAEVAVPALVAAVISARAVTAVASSRHRVPVVGYRYFGSDAVLPSGTLGLLALAVALLGGFFGALSMPRSGGVQDTSTVSIVAYRSTHWRLAPLAAGLATAPLSVLAGGQPGSYLLAIGLAACFVGTPLALPLVVRSFGSRLGSASPTAVHLAGRRLQHLPTAAGLLVGLAALAGLSSIVTAANIAFLSATETSGPSLFAGRHVSRVRPLTAQLGALDSGSLNGSTVLAVVTVGDATFLTGSAEEAADLGLDTAGGRLGGGVSGWGLEDLRWHPRESLAETHPIEELFVLSSGSTDQIDMDVRSWAFGTLDFPVVTTPVDLVQLANGRLAAWQRFGLTAGMTLLVAALVIGLVDGILRRRSELSALLDIGASRRTCEAVIVLVVGSSIIVGSVVALALGSVLAITILAFTDAGAFPLGAVRDVAGVGIVAAAAAAATSVWGVRLLAREARPARD